MMNKIVRFVCGMVVMLAVSACLQLGFGIGFGSGNIGLGVSGNVPLSKSSPQKAHIPVVPPSVAVERAIAAQLAEVNRLRTEQGVLPLYHNAALDAYAAVRAQELSQRFSSQRLDGSDALNDVYGSQIKAENRARTAKLSAQLVVTKWRADGEQRARMLQADFRETGVGVYMAADGSVYWVQLFAGKNSDSDYRFVE